MKNTAQARYTRNETVKTYLFDRASVFAGDVSMTTIFAKFNSSISASMTSSIAAEMDNTGYSSEKHIAKLKVCNTAAELSSNAQVKLDILGMIIISKSLHGTMTYFFSAADALCVSRLMGDYEIMLENLALLTPDYLTAVMLTGFLGEINTFKGLRGSTALINGGHTVLTKQAAADLNITFKDIVTLKKSALKYKTSNATFYNGLMQACKIPTITVHHTTANLDIIDAVTKIPLGGVSGTMSKAKGAQISNPEGVLFFPALLSGHSTGILSKTGYISKLINMDIMQGVNNTASYSLTQGTMTTEEEAALNLSLSEAIAADKTAIAQKVKTKKALKAAALAAIKVLEAAKEI